MRIPVTLLVLLLQPMAGLAVTSGPVERDHVVVELVSAVQHVQPGEPFRVGLAMDHAPNWHTYWENPGDSGLETKFRWTLPDGFEAGAIEWPWPEKHRIEHLVNYGYSDRHMLPVTLTPPADLEAGSTVEIGLKADWLICEIECIPGSAELALTLPVASSPAASSRFIDRFEAADARRAVAREWPATFAVSDGQFSLQVRGVEGLETNTLEFFPAHPTLVEHAADPFIALDGNTLQIVQPLSPFFSRAPEALRFLLVDPANEIGVELMARPGALESTGPAPESMSAELPASLAWVLLLALAGGVLLNLMPCVFPVLSLKAMSLVGGGPDHAGRHGLAYTAGVLISFALLAGTLLALRSGGEAIGWGFQLQSPLFVALLVLVLFAMALSLSGVFEMGTRWMGIGQGLTESGGLRGSFFTGVLATIVASPCTAPLMATALGLAVLLPTVQAMAVFLALGLGLALPLLVLGFVPALARALPKPGPWMDTFRRLMAFPLYLTVVWLLWVLGNQVGVDGLAAMLAGLVALAFALWLAGRGSSQGLTGTLGHIAVGLALLGTLAGLLNAVRLEAPAAAETRAASAFSPERLAELNRDPTRGVLVNMTADWCVTCKVNERVALATDRVRDSLDEMGYVYLVGDWTRRDPVITRYLQDFERNGVPLYVLYPPGDDPQPIVLPQILTPGSVVRALRDAAGDQNNTRPTRPDEIH